MGNEDAASDRFECLLVQPAAIVGSRVDRASRVAQWKRHHSRPQYAGEVPRRMHVPIRTVDCGWGQTSNWAFRPDRVCGPVIVFGGKRRQSQLHIDALGSRFSALRLRSQGGDAREGMVQHHANTDCGNRNRRLDAKFTCVWGMLWCFLGSNSPGHGPVSAHGAAPESPRI